MFLGPRGHHRSRGHPRRGRHGPRPHCPPPFSPHFPGCHPRGGAGFGCHFGNPWQNQSQDWTPQPHNDKQNDDKQNDGNKQGQSQSSTNEQEMPTFQEILSQVSEMAMQYINPGKISRVSWDNIV